MSWASEMFPCKGAAMFFTLCCLIKGTQISGTGKQSQNLLREAYEYCSAHLDLVSIIPAASHLYCLCCRELGGGRWAPALRSVFKPGLCHCLILGPWEWKNMAQFLVQKRVLQEPHCSYYCDSKHAFKASVGHLQPELAWFWFQWTAKNGASHPNAFEKDFIFTKTWFLSL